MMSACSLCDLPVSERPVTAEEVAGEFCCRGCLEVARVLDETDRAESVMESHSVASETGDDSSEKLPADAAETYLAVEGMHCTTCEAFLGLRGDHIEGIDAVEANYAVQTARVRYDPDTLDEEELPGLLSGHGYTVRFRHEDGDELHCDRPHQRGTVQRLLVGGFFSMLVMPWYFFYLYPSYVGIETGLLYTDTTTTVGLYLPLVFIGLFTTVVLFYTGYPVLRGAWVSLRTGHPNMDLLVSVAALSAYAYSTVALATGSTHLYYDVSVAVVMVVTLGRYYEGSIRSRATDRLSALTAARVREATLLTDEGRETVPIEDLEPGDSVVVTPGERVPVDGTVREGVAAVDESVLTGESLPTTKRPGSDVVGGALVTDDALVVEVGPAVESTVDRIATTLWEIQSTAPGVQRLADALATIFVPLVLTLGAVVTVWQLTTGSTVAAALLAGLTVLVVSCPCAMGLATPLAISAGLRDALQSGIVVANESVFEVAPEVDIVVFDKTGTLTAGEMVVTDQYGDDETLRLAAAVERFSSHPVADAILDATDSLAGSADQPMTGADAVADGGLAVSGDSDASTGDGGTGGTDGGDARREGGDRTPAGLPDASEFTRHPGEGVAGTVEDRRVVVGTPDLVERLVGPLPDELEACVTDIERDGGLAVVVGWDGRAQGVLGVGDHEREEWEAAVEAFADREIAVLTGDDGPGAERFREHPTIDTVFAGVPPDGKVEAIRRLSATGTTVMVGDGTNDAPALAAADLGIAMGDGTASAVDAADVVVTENDLTAVEEVFDLAAGTRWRIRENICWAFLYNAVAIPLAVVGLINPLFAALAMAASSIIVVSNSRRPVR